MKNLNFAYVTDTRLADDGINIANKLELCDKDANFRCIVHVEMHYVATTLKKFQ